MLRLSRYGSVSRIKKMIAVATWRTATVAPHDRPDDRRGAHRAATIGLKSGKAKASRGSGGWVPYRTGHGEISHTPLGTEARLMFDILRYILLRLGDASRFGPVHPQRTLKIMMVKVAPEQGKVRTPAAVPVHRDFAVSLAAALAISGMEKIEAYDQMKTPILRCRSSRTE
jgi:hypothetical protein